MPLSALPKDQLLTGLISALVQKLQIEGTIQLFERRTFPTNALCLNDQNALLLDFTGLPPKPRYRLLISFAHHDLQAVDAQFQRDADRTMQTLTSDRAMFWVARRPRPNENLATIALAASHVDLTVVPFPTAADLTTRVIHNFVFLPILSYEQNYAVNILANRLIKRMRKKFHLILSEVAAPTYDLSYGKSSIATRRIMQYEEQLLVRIVPEIVASAEQPTLAVDVGCGTGRHSRQLAKHFQGVIAFDFSQEMINVCHATRQNEANQPAANRQSFSNIMYHVVDFEYDDIPGEADLIGTVNFVCASFGMGSFIEDTTGMLRRFSTWLRPSGKVYLSFYNAASINIQLLPSWRDSSLSTVLDVSAQSLQVELAKNVRFSIFCKPFDARVMEAISNVFTVESVYTYPTTLALMPNTLLLEEPAEKLFAHIDDLLAGDPVQNGHYVLVVARKPERPLTGFDRIMRQIKEAQVPFTLVSHEPVITLADVERLLTLPAAALVKTVIFRSKQTGRYIVVVVPGQKRVDAGRLAEMLGEPRRSVRLASEEDIVRSFGLPIGGVSPIGFPATVEDFSTQDDEATLFAVCLFIDAEFQRSQCEEFYMGVGDNTKTLKLSRSAFLLLVSTYRPLEVLG